MSWQEQDAMSLRREFVTLAQVEGANVRRLCRRFRISPQTGYKWLARFTEHGLEGLEERSRRPRVSPRQSSAEVEREVLEVRGAHPAWGGRKIRAFLLQKGVELVPAASTITAILRRQGCVDPQQSLQHHAWQRFEAAAPNHLWQMDFKGSFDLAQGPCHPLTVLDDHSRFSLALEACMDQRTATVQEHLTRTFRRYGLPEKILQDNGSPWGHAEHGYTPLTVWMIRLGISPHHSRPRHPQTLGKDERFHRTLKAELLSYQRFKDFSDCQSKFEIWRQSYNFERPHQALDMQVPASRYRDSPRGFPEQLPAIEYGPDDMVRKVQIQGKISFQGRDFVIPKAFRGYPVALRPTTTDGLLDVFFCHLNVAQIDLRQPQ
jgi:transposase InsO family protein